MLENRSFDHLLGYLDHPVEGVREGVFANSRLDGTVVPVTKDGQPFGADPDHSYDGVHEQLGGSGTPRNGGFVINYERHLAEVAGQLPEPDGADVMKCLKPEEQCKVLATLATEFAVCDHWFSSVPGETWPNRNFAHAATSDGSVNIEIGFFWDPTIFEHISRVTDQGSTESLSKAWRIYYDGPPEVWCFRRLWRSRTIIDWLLRRRARIGNWFEMKCFYDHVSAGDLPKYSFIEPAHNNVHAPDRQTNSQHPGNNKRRPDDFYAGERLVADIYNALLARPELFKKTLLLIVYDEHGGFYDHVDPAAGGHTVPPGDPIYRSFSREIGRRVRRFVNWRHHRKETETCDFTSLGLRVPAVLVSPWITRGTVVSKRLEHASIPATLRLLFADSLKPLTARDDVANTFDDVVLGRSEPRCRAPSPDPDGLGDVLPEIDVGPTPTGAAAAGDEEEMVMADGAVEGGPVTSPTVVDQQLEQLARRVHRRIGWRPSVVARRARLRRTAVRRARARGATPDAVEAFAHLAAAARGEAIGSARPQS
jgi:phospholipase C